MKDQTIGIVGLGYVGLPLAVAFGRVRSTIGFDVSTQKIESYRRGTDPTGEVSPAELTAATQLTYTANASDLAAVDIIIVAVPTPVTDARLPDFGPLLSASRAIGPYLKSGAVVVYESTVYPGATEEVCIPELERASGKKWKRDFFVGYSPERINPGDKEHTLAKITKVVSGDTPTTLDRVAAAYESVVTAGVYRASSIQVAEAAKVIENTQRDLNIALMNELAIIFNRMGLDTKEVLDAAGTKWNFLKFKPGLVGGHCIGVDPYYLTYQAEKFGHHAEVILAGRRINDSMGGYVAQQTIKCMVAAYGALTSGNINVLGMTFKENCPDLRNSKVIDIITGLREFGQTVTIHDPYASSAEAHEHYGESLSDWSALPKANAIVVAVAHKHYLDLGVQELLQTLKPGGVVIDVKSALDRDAVGAMGFKLWRL
ncbi:MAG: nucleotide sugar dehydrogenase [Rhodocyclaceae bacterium]|nr:nucleotide sugar dehydrogenase [Rhodocyclaceae bacterium]MCA3025104.1 nucleotide sugar dehydrogenase [Rhodocyclaceae bacterium]MCA3031195.1 nucleotide sugar dehydrogenase [Rhodocyclaceae bacterium]MCA3038620.1 nucleotide sugar dehydrogenase [Rhodocyclaceae bacterium]MCA3047171.1 nucleotide sugar dehydrogenase [Rhodocyclaceae bacterium]